MASERQINANRKNSEKCTGPRTFSGKAISSQNALKTGLDAKSDVIRTENREDYEALTAEYYVRFHPTVPEERCLVDTLIASEWLGRRYLRADAATWEQRFEDTKSQSVARVFKERSDILVHAGRRINSAQRNFQQALKQLRDIQVGRAGEEPFDLNLPLDDRHQPTHPPTAPEPTLPSRDCNSSSSEGAVPEPSDPADTTPERLKPELVSILAQHPVDQPQPVTPTSDPETEENPPIAA